VRLWSWTESRGGFDPLPGVVILELRGAQVAERGVQPASVVDLVNAFHWLAYWDVFGRPPAQPRYALFRSGDLVVALRPLAITTIPLPNNGSLEYRLHA